VKAVHRRGKYLWFELDKRPWPSFHFGMSGSFRVYEKDKDRPRHMKVELIADDGTRLAMRDARRFGRIRLHEDPATAKPICDLGFDALLSPASAKQLRECLVPRKAPIKAVLLDQAVFAGVGNWIADEVLYQAKISPHRAANTLSGAEIARLRQALAVVIRHAVKVDADRNRFPETWLFGRRWGRNAAAVTHRGEKIVHDTIGGRTAAWVPEVQK
jgi:formamidopyrimidine-DNA glycosylase